MTNRPTVPLLGVLLAWAIGAGAATDRPPAAANPDLRAAVARMKDSDRGPFARIRWFCKDGTTLDPVPYGCKAHGGGHQHGERTEAVERMRADGYLLANILASLDVDALLAAAEPATALGQILIERFLIDVDDGWILRRARFYRGALQEEGERAGARRLLFRLAEDPDWLQRRYLLLRTATRLLPHGRDTADVRDVRQSAADLAGRDRDFVRLRNKIHVRPERADAGAVRDYAAALGDDERAAPYLELAAAIETVYAQTGPSDRLAYLAQALTGPSRTLVSDGAAALKATSDARARLAVAADLLVKLRDAALLPNGPLERIVLLDASLAIESAFYVAAAEIAGRLDGSPRRELVELLAASTDAAYGTGLLSARQRRALGEAFAGLAAAELALPDYKRAVEYLSRVPGWGTRAMQLHFGRAVERYLALDPLAALFVQDQLRGGPLFFYGAVVDRLATDAQRLAGIGAEMFGEPVGAGLRGLNPGLARGTLHVVGTEDPAHGFRPDGIYLLPETVSDLPPVAGILTRGEGNPLSHVQLLARNLGIPNVAVEESLVARLARHDGAAVTLAVSPGGVVRLALDDGTLAELFAARAAEPGFVIRPDLDKLDLSRREPVPLTALRAADSGRLVGPKAAKLGELKHHYPEAVANGVAIPFGVFRALLDRPLEGEGASVYDWMVAQYGALAAMPAGSADREAATDRFRARLQAWIEGAAPDPAFIDSLRETLVRELGGLDRGVFVRSDTNVEDLPGFTGAGLNLTLPNVTGIAAIAAAVPRVWASPFTARAFAWRQAHMDRPEHVYPAVLLLESVPAEKSGVLVTRDIDTGAPGWLSVAVNEGIGGAVDGQAAESLRIDLATGAVRLLAQATAPTRRRLLPEGGMIEEPASLRDEVLAPGEIAQLVEFGRGLPGRFPPIVDEQGRPTAADVEFGFVDGRLRLFQIRPLNENRAARSNAWLAGLDPDPARLATVRVDLEAAP